MVTRTCYLKWVCVGGCCYCAEASGVGRCEVVTGTDLGGSSDFQMKPLKSVMEKGCTSTVFGSALAGAKPTALAVKNVHMNLAKELRVEIPARQTKFDGDTFVCKNVRTSLVQLPRSWQTHL